MPGPGIWDGHRQSMFPYVLTVELTAIFLQDRQGGPFGRPPPGAAATDPILCATGVLPSGSQ